jgi:hypothetical protein
VITCDVDESVQSVREPCVNTQAEGISLGSSSPASLYRISLVRTMSIATTLAQQKRQLNVSKCSLGVVASDSHDAGMAMSDLALEDIIKDFKAQNSA